MKFIDVSGLHRWDNGGTLTDCTTGEQAWGGISWPWCRQQIPGTEFWSQYA